MVHLKVGETTDNSNLVMSLWSEILHGPTGIQTKNWLNLQNHIQIVSIQTVFKKTKTEIAHGIISNVG